MSDDDLSRPRDAIVRGLLSVPAAAAISVGLLYSVGALLKTAELRGAGVEAEDVLPLISIEELLARGIAEIADHFFQLATYTALSIGFIVVSHRRREALERQIAGDRAAFEKAHPDLGPRIQGLKDAIQLAAGAEGLAAQLAELKIEREIADVEAKSAAALKAAEAEAAEARQELEKLEPSMRRLRYILLAVALVSLLGNPPALGIGFCIFSLLVAFSWKLRLSTAALVVLAWVSVSVSILSGEFIAPRPLPMAEIQLANSGKSVRGELVAQSSGVWYVAVGKRQIEAVPVSSMLRALVRERVRKRTPSLAERAIDLIS